MQKGFFYSFITSSFLLFVFHSSASGGNAELKSINFKQKGEVSELELFLSSNNVVVSKFHVADDKQVIIDLKGVQASKRVMRAFDTSEFSGAVVFVSAYQKPGKKDDIRIALQLRDNVRTLLTRGPNRIILKIENRFGVFNKQQITENDTVRTGIGKKVDNNDGVGKLLIPKSDSLEDILENLTLSGRKKYIGKRISLDVKDVSVSDILKMIAEASGFNIILIDKLDHLNPLNLSLTNTPWDQVLDIVLELNKLVAKKNGIILTIQTLASATRDEQEKISAKEVALNQLPMVTKVFRISHASTQNISKILREYLTKGRGKISEDKRTNYLIVKDLPEVIEKIRKIIEVLDIQTPQVLIESKIVEINESYSKEIGLRQGVKFGYDPIGKIGGRTPTVVGGPPTSGVDGGPGFTFNSAPADVVGGVRNLFGFAVKRFGRLTDLNFTLQLMESESKGRVISSPKIITQSKKKATLTSSKSDAYRKSIFLDNKEEVSYEEVTANINLDVTPQVTSEGSIILEIQIAKEDFGDRTFTDGPPRKVSSTISTNVLVNNGSTIVIGGIYEYSASEQHSGVPFLKNVPLIGWLFRTPHAPKMQKREVVIFITPRIINQEEAGFKNRG